MKEKHDTLLVTSIANIAYLTNYSNFSLNEREAYLLLTDKKNYIITDGRYTQEIKANVAHFELIERSAENSLEKIFSHLVKNLKIKTVDFEEEDVTAGELKRLRKYFAGATLTPTTGSIEKERLIKKQNEIRHIQKACLLADNALEHTIKKIKSGISEKEIAFEIEFFIKKHGGDISFPPIVAFGKNSAVPHHQTSNQKLKSNQIVLLDLGAKVDNYCSDMTRTVFFGKAPDEFKKMYQTVLDAQKLAIENLKSSILNHKSKNKIILASRIDNAARSYIIKQRYPDIPHSVGHGIGIEVHESPHISPKSKDQLKQGMVFSVEPGIYQPGHAGVRIEDLFYLSSQGLKQLTHFPKHLLELS